jgi:hypothetical protein
VGGEKSHFGNAASAKTRSKAADWRGETPYHVLGAPSCKYEIEYM